jgi:hypothetical protein
MPYSLVHWYQYFLEPVVSTPGVLQRVGTIYLPNYTVSHQDHDLHIHYLGSQISYRLLFMVFVIYAHYWTFFVHVCGIAVESANDFIAWLFILYKTLSNENHVCMSDLCMLWFQHCSVSFFKLVAEIKRCVFMSDFNMSKQNMEQRTNFKFCVK